MIKIKHLNVLILFGLLAIIGVLVVQINLLNQAYQYEKKGIEDKIHFALKDVLQKIHRDNNVELPYNNEIQKVTSDYYIVNVNDVFDNNVLEYYLKNEFEKVKLDLDYEYAIYDCSSDEMVYGNYVSKQNKSAPCDDCFKKDNNLIYYFGIRFPNLKIAIINTLGLYWVLTTILFLVLLIYVYSTYTLLKYQRLALLQKDFVNNMTHEFKTPLTSILIASKQMQNNSNITQNKQQQYLGIINSQADILNKHVEKILQIAQTEQSEKLIHKQPFNLLEVISTQKDTFVQLKNIGFEIDIPKDTVINGDVFHISNVFFNLTENAIKYVEKNLKINIKTILSQKELIVEFSDNGQGVNKDELQYLFDKFYRVQNSKTNKIKGFGLGLFYVKKIIDLHNWKISVTNNSPNGLKYSISIPKKDVINYG